MRVEGLERGREGERESTSSGTVGVEDFHKHVHLLCGFGFRVLDLGFGVWGSGRRVQGSGFRV